MRRERFVAFGEGWAQTERELYRKGVRCSSGLVVAVSPRAVVVSGVGGPVLVTDDESQRMAARGSRYLFADVSGIAMLGREGFASTSLGVFEKGVVTRFGTVESVDRWGAVLTGWDGKPVGVEFRYPESFRAHPFLQQGASGSSQTSGSSRGKAPLAGFGAPVQSAL